MIGTATLALVLLSQPRPGVRTVSSGEIVRVTVAVPADHAVVGAIEQGETDLAVAVLDPDGQPVGEFDARERSDDIFVFVAGRSGSFTLAVRSLAAGVRGARFGVRYEIRPLGPDIDRLAMAAGLHGEAKQLFTKGDRASLEQAIDRLRRAGALWRALGQPALELAALTGTGDARYMMSDYAGALETYRHALEASRGLGDLRTQAEVLNNMAMVAWPLGDIGNALQWLGEANDGWRALAFTPGEATAVSNRGIMFWESGDYDEARRHYLRALDLFEKTGDTARRAYALNNLGVLQEALGEPAQALTYLGRAIVLFRRTNDRLAEGRAEVRRARVYLALGQLTQSGAALARALPLIRRSADRLAEGDAVAQRGRLLDEQGRGVPARDEFQRALDLYRGVGSRRGAADALYDIGVSHLRQRDAAGAVPFLDQSREIRHTLGLKPVEAESLYRLAEAERRRGDLARARAYIEEALAIVETLRSGVLEKQSRASYADSKRQYFALYVDLLADSHTAWPGAGYDRLAFEAAERARTRGLTELLRESWSAVATTAPPALSQREQSLRKQINYWSWQLWQRAAQPEGAGRQAADATLARLIVEHDQAVAEIRRSDPRYASILVPQSFPLARIRQELLDADTALISFHLGSPRSLGWAVTRDSLKLIALPARAEIERRVKRYLDAVTVVDPARKADAAPAAAALSRMVLAPLGEALRYKRVVIVGDGVLQGIPFAALPGPDGAPLLEAHEVVAMPSATVLAMIHSEFADRRRAPRTLAVIADPVFDAGDPRVRRPAHADAALEAGPRLSRLPHSRDEADRILALVPEALRMRAVDFDASRATVTSAAMRQYGLVHLATHGVPNARRPSLSGIALSMVDADGAPQDGFLRLHDVYNLRLAADLVVLSACETGTGQVSLGEGVTSLARGLFHAGAARVVSALWKVDDEATAVMMEAFYKRLLSAPASSTAAALRGAQADMRANPRWQHPYYWAGFALQGLW